MQPTSKRIPTRFAGLRYLAVGGLGVVLLLFGQFDEWLFAELTRVWHSVFTLFGYTSPPPVQHLSTHSLPVAISYRLLYAGCSVLLLHVLLRGQATRWLIGGYLAILLVSFLLLLVGRATGLAFATWQAHWLLDLLSSPLAVLLVYVLATLRSQSTAVATPLPTTQASAQLP